MVQPIKIHKERKIRSKPEQVFEILCNFDNASLLIPGVVQTGEGTHQKATKGARGKFVMYFYSIYLDCIMTVLECKKDELLKYKIEGDAEAVLEYSLKPTPNGDTLLIMNGSFSPPTYLPMLAARPIIKYIATKQAEAYLGNIKIQAEITSTQKGRLKGSKN